MAFLIKETQPQIKKIKNSHTGAKREQLIIYPGMQITGIISMCEQDGEYIVEVGYNETIVCVDKEAAEHIMITICGEL